MNQQRCSYFSRHSNWIDCGVNCGRMAGQIEMLLGKNFRRLQIFSVEISGPKWIYFVNFRCTMLSGPGPAASASPASWMIWPCLCNKFFHTCITHSTVNSIVTAYSRATDQNDAVILLHHSFSQSRLISFAMGQ